MVLKEIHDSCGTVGRAAAAYSIPTPEVCGSNLVVGNFRQKS